MRMIMIMANWYSTIAEKMGHFMFVLVVFFLVFYPNTFQKGKTVTW